MAENTTSEDAKPRRVQGQHLSKAEKQELAEQALAMSVKGKSVTDIAEELNVNWKTANKLVDFALQKREIDEDEEREKSLAHHHEIVRWCWEQLEDDEMGAHAQNRPAYIARIQASQAEIDRLNNVTPPLRTQQDIHVSYRDYTTGEELEGLFEEIDSFLDAQDGEADSEESLDSEEAHS